MIKKRIRRIKLHCKNREVNGGWRNISYQHVPWLNVSGDWLVQAGFNIGDQVEITVENKLLTIKNCSSDGDSRN